MLGCNFFFIKLDDTLNVLSEKGLFNDKLRRLNSKILKYFIHLGI